MSSREEHVAQCKKTALAYLDDGDPVSAVTSMLSDLSHHPETREIGETMGPMGLFVAMKHDEDECRRFIEGFR